MLDRVLRYMHMINIVKPSQLANIMFYIFLLFPLKASAVEIITKLSPAQALIEDIRKGGHILYMRHGITDIKTKIRNKAVIDLNKCDTQRNLSDEGRKQVKRIGALIKSLNIPVGEVKSSPYCRTKDTAKAVFGEYSIDEMLAFSISKDRKESQILGAHLKNLIYQSNTQNHNIALVGHTANLKDGLGVWPKPEGVVVIFKVENDQIVYRGMIKPTDWPKL